MDAGAGTLLTLSVFADRAGAEEANRIAADWAGRHLAGRREEGDRLLDGAETVMTRAGDRNTPGHAMLLVGRGNAAAQHADWGAARP